MFSINDIIEIAVKLENNSEDTYRKAKDVMNRHDLNPFFDWIVKEENEHAEWFKSLKEKVEKGEEGLLKEMTEALLDDYIGDQTFSLKEVDFETLDKPMDLFSVFIEFEKDTIMFYDLLKNFVSDKAVLDKIDVIIDEEKHHIKKIKEIQESQNESRV